MLVFNYVGLAMIIAALVVGYAVQGVVEGAAPTNDLAVCVACVVAGLTDVGWRWYARPLDGPVRFISLGGGGQLMFLPLWLIAFAGFVYGLTQLASPSAI